MANISFRWQGDLASVLRKAANRVVETRSLLTSFAKRLRYTFQLNIAQGREPEGDPFKPLVRPIRKKLRKNDPRPLIDTGTLINSFEYQFVGLQTVEVGDPTKYGIYHQFGTKHVPARSFIGIRPDDAQQLADLTRGWTYWVMGVYDGDTSQGILDFNN